MIRSYRRGACWAFLALCLAAPAAPAQVEITQASLDAMAAEVVPLVEKATGQKLAGCVTFRITTLEELRTVLRSELLPQMKLQFEDGVQAAAQAEQAVAIMAPALVAKYALGKKEVLVCPGNIENIRSLLGEPLLQTREGLLAVLAHECVHASDDLRYDIGKTLLTRRTLDALQAYNAVMEGHAQHVARAVSRRAGWSEGFEAFTRSIGSTPGDESMGEGMRYLSRMLTAALASAYYDGEAFIRTLEEKGGPEAVERAFRSPPDEFELIFHPEWFLDPSTRPASAFDLHAGLDALAARFDGEAWAVQKTSVPAPQLRAAYSLLPEDDVSRLLASLRQTQAMVLSPRSGLRDRMIVVMLMEFGAPAGAIRYLAASEKLVRLKDEKMKTGLVRILSADYTPIRRPDFQGLYCRKDIKAMSKTIQASSLVAVRGCLGIEVTYSNIEGDRKTLEDHALAALRAAFERTGATEGREKKD